jgi:glutamate-1-semialdehyde 2,1-aminomutase
VASAVRAPQLPVPIAFATGRGAHLTDIDGNDYIDYGLAYGPMLLGHSPEVVLEAVVRQMADGIGYGASHELEAELAEAICRTVPSAELCILATSGSDAVLAALRIARAATGRNKVVKFLGHFHGWPDPLAIGAPGHAGRDPNSGGQDPKASESVVVCPWNDEAALARVLDGDVAAVIMEPVAVNGGCFVADPGYLEAARQLTHAAGAVLIFDEVITGYRLSLGGAQERLGVMPDLTVLGKAMGAGFPISAVCGRADLMELVASGQVAHMGTFNGSPLSVAAALAAISELERARTVVYPRLDQLGQRLAQVLRSAASGAGVPLVVNQLGPAAYAFWSDAPVDRYEQAAGADGDRYRVLAESLLDEGVHVIPRGLLYVSTVHSDADLDRTAEAAVRAAVKLTAQTSSA